MVRNLDRLDTLTAERVKKIVQWMAEAVDDIGTESMEMTCDYQTADCEPGDLLPVIKIGVVRVKGEVHGVS